MTFAFLSVCGFGWRRILRQSPHSRRACGGPSAARPVCRRWTATKLKGVCRATDTLLQSGWDAEVRGQLFRWHRDFSVQPRTRSRLQLITGLWCDKCGDLLAVLADQLIHILSWGRLAGYGFSNRQLVRMMSRSEKDAVFVSDRVARGRLWPIVHLRERVPNDVRIGVIR